MDIKSSNLSHVNVDENATLNFKERAGYGVGDFASNMMYAAVNSFMTYFFTNIAGISAGIAGTILLVSRLFDGFSDVLVGVGMEKIKSKHGKARPWILWGAIPFAISLILLFTAPDIGMKGKIIYAFVTYNLATTIMFTAVNLPFGSLAAMMTKNQYERGILNISKMICAFTGGLVINMATLPMVEFFGGGSRGWQLTFVVFGTIAAVLFFVTFKTTKERVVVSNEEKEKVNIKAAIKSLPRNKYWIILLGAFFFQNLSNAITSGVNVYYCEYILGQPGLVGSFAMYQTVSALITFFLLSFFVKKMGKRNTAILGTLISIVGCIVIVAMPTNINMLYISNILKGIGNAAVSGVIYGMLADTIEYNEWKSGIRAEGLVFSANSVGIKVGQGIGAAALGWGLAMVGFVGTAANQTQASLNGISFMFVMVPIIFFVIQLGFLFLYKLDKEYDRIVKDLEARKN